MPPLKQTADYFQCIRDLIFTPEVLSMSEIPQHVDIICLFHSIFVSYVSFRICQALGWNAAAAARGGLLHDLFLYDWRQKGSHEGLHGFTHPQAALRNASDLCELTDLEKDIIVKHMWPLTISKMPKHRETFVVSCADKLCALAEMFHIYHALHMGLRLALASGLLQPLREETHDG